jgi:hypothetical protein
MRGRKIPTISGVLLIATGIVAGIVVTSYLKSVNTGHHNDIAPRDIRISNISDSSFNVSWVTNSKTSGAIKLGDSTTSVNEKVDNSISNPSYTHSVKIEKLSPKTTYYFTILSNTKLFDNDEIPWQVRTASKSSPPGSSKVISGSVYDQFNWPSRNALVYVTVAGSSFLSTVTSENGSWVIPTTEARTQGLDGFVSIDDKNSLIEIFIQAGPNGNTSAQIYPISARPAPPMILGQNYNFKAFSLGIEQSPQAEFNIPEEGIKAPTFLLKN